MNVNLAAFVNILVKLAVNTMDSLVVCSNWNISYSILCFSICSVGKIRKGVLEQPVLFQSSAIIHPYAFLYWNPEGNEKQKNDDRSITSTLDLGWCDIKQRTSCRGLPTICVCPGSKGSFWQDWHNPKIKYKSSSRQPSQFRIMSGTQSIGNSPALRIRNTHSHVCTRSISVFLFDWLQWRDPPTRKRFWSNVTQITFNRSIAALGPTIVKPSNP